MSLLDFNMPEMDSPQGQGLLSAAFSLMQAKGPSLSNAIGQAGGQYMDSYGRAKENAAQEEMRRLQIDAYKRKMEQEKAAMELAARQRQATGKLFSVSGGGGGFSPTLGKDGMPVFDGAMNFSPVTPHKLQLNQAAVMEALAAGVPAKDIHEYASLQNLGKSKVARTIKGIGPDGREYEYQLDEFGNKQGDGFAQFRAPEKLDRGGQIDLLDAYTNKPILSLPKSQTPDSKASNAVAWANNALSRERLNFDKAGGAEAVKQSRPEWKDGQWVVPPKDMKPGETRAVNPAVNTKDAKDALMIIGEAEKYIDQATGSGVGTALDWMGRAVGHSTKGDTAIGQLKALEGVLVSKMPKMSGPQSDKDVALYKQMAAEIGDPMMPNSRKKAALQVVKQIQQKYAEQGQGGASGTWGQGQFKILSVE